MAFRVGQTVVCVDDASCGTSMAIAYRDFPGSAVFKGKIYTIKDVGLTFGGSHGVRLVEIKLNNESGVDLFYKSSRFRPLTDTKTSISFTEGAPLDTQHLDNRRKLPAKVSS